MSKKIDEKFINKFKEKLTPDQKEALNLLIQLVNEPRIPTNENWDKVLENL